MTSLGRDKLITSHGIPSKGSHLRSPRSSRSLNIYFFQMKSSIRVFTLASKLRGSTMITSRCHSSGLITRIIGISWIKHANAHVILSFTYFRTRHIRCQQSICEEFPILHLGFLEFTHYILTIQLYGLESFHERYHIKDIIFYVSLKRAHIRATITMNVMDYTVLSSSLRHTIQRSLKWKFGFALFSY